MSARKIIWLLVFAVLALIALAVALANFPTDKSSAATIKSGQITGTLVNGPAFVSQQLVNDGTLYGSAALDSDSASVSKTCGALAKARRSIVTTAPTGRMYTSHFNQGYCRRNGHLTWVGPMKFWGDVGNAGHALGISFDHGEWIYHRYFVWGGNNHPDGGHTTIGMVKWQQCFSQPGPLTGRICHNVDTDYGKLLVFSDGHSQFYRLTLCDIAGLGCRPR